MAIHPHRRRFGAPLMPPLSPTPISLINSLINFAHEIVDGPYSLHRPTLSLCQKRNVGVISRRVKTLLMLLEEVRDSASPLSPSALLCFNELHVVLEGVKLLSDDCAESSRIWLLMEHRRLSEYFHQLTQEMATALEILPVASLDVSCEVREQVELVRQQARKAKLYVDPKESQLWAEVQSVMGQIERKETPEVARLARIFSSLELTSASDCQQELQRLVEEEIDGSWEAQARRTENRKISFNDLVSFVRYSKCVLYGATEIEEVEAEVSEELNEEDEMKVPDDFRCPISLDLMKDPVIVATGQTYERASITRWMEEGNQTCPKSGLKMAHTTLITNYALRSLIWEWCERHNIRLLPLDKPHCHNSASQSTPTALEATKLTAEFLLRQLPSAAPDTRRHIAGELRLLAKCGADNRKVIADAGAITLLIPLLSTADARTQEHAVTAILNLSIFPPNKPLIVDAGALDPLIGLLRNANTTDAARENSAAALFSLSHQTDYAAVLGEKPEAIDGLLQLFREGSQRGKRDASSALFNIAVYHPNRAKLVKAGVVGVLLELLSQPGRPPVLEEEALAVLAVLAGSVEGRAAITGSSAEPLLVGLLGIASPNGKEYAVVILHYLCRYGGHCVIRNVKNVLPSLHSLLTTGTPRARRKAAALLRVLGSVARQPMILR